MTIGARDSFKKSNLSHSILRLLHNCAFNGDRPYGRRVKAALGHRSAVVWHHTFAALAVPQPFGAVVYRVLAAPIAAADRQAGNIQAVLLCRFELGAQAINLPIGNLHTILCW